MKKLLLITALFSISSFYSYAGYYEDACKHYEEFSRDHTLPMMDFVEILNEEMKENDEKLKTRDADKTSLMKEQDKLIGMFQATATTGLMHGLREKASPDEIERLKGYIRQTTVFIDHPPLEEGKSYRDFYKIRYASKAKGLTLVFDELKKAHKTGGLYESQINAYAELYLKDDISTQLKEFQYTVEGFGFYNLSEEERKDYKKEKEKIEEQGHEIFLSLTQSFLPARFQNVKLKTQKDVEKIVPPLSKEEKKDFDSSIYKIKTELEQNPKVVEIEKSLESIDEKYIDHARKRFFSDFKKTLTDLFPSSLRSYLFGKDIDQASDVSYFENLMKTKYKNDDDDFSEKKKEVLDNPWKRIGDNIVKNRSSWETENVWEKNQILKIIEALVKSKDTRLEEEYRQSYNDFDLTKLTQEQINAGKKYIESKFPNLLLKKMRISEDDFERIKKDSAHEDEGKDQKEQKVRLEKEIKTFEDFLTTTFPRFSQQKLGEPGYIDTQAYKSEKMQKAFKEINDILSSRGLKDTGTRITLVEDGDNAPFSLFYNWRASSGVENLKSAIEECKKENQRRIQEITLQEEAHLKETEFNRSIQAFKGSYENWILPIQKEFYTHATGLVDALKQGSDPKTHPILIIAPNDDEDLDFYMYTLPLDKDLTVNEVKGIYFYSQDGYYYGDNGTLVQLDPSTFTTKHVLSEYGMGRLIKKKPEVYNSLMQLVK